MKAPVAAAPGGPEPRTYGLITPTGVVMALLLAIPFCFLFAFFFSSQHLFSWGSGDWSHAYFVPLISLYMLWQRRAELSRAPVRAFWPGLIPLLIAIPAYGFAQIKAVPGTHMIQGWSMVLCLFGLVLLLCGPVVARVALIPVAFLLFGITVSEKILLEITGPLQLIASKGAHLLLNLVGVQTDISGTVLTVTTSDGPKQLNVAQQCSGMRMVIAFLALGVAVAVVGVRYWWQRILLILLAVPLAIAMNVIRVAVLGVATTYDPDLANGQSHMLIGTLLLVPTFLLYMLIVWCLNRVIHEPPAKASSPPGPAPFRVRWGKLGRAPFVTAAGCLIVGTIGINAALASMGAHLRKTPIYAENNRRVQAIPTETASFIRVGNDQVMSEDMVTELGTSNYLSRTYVLKNTPEGQKPVRLELHLAYYTGMIDTVPHVQERCMTGGGWDWVGTSAVIPLKLDDARWTRERDAQGQAIDRWRASVDIDYSDAEVQRVRLPRDPQNISMMVSEFASGNARMIGGYFFIANGGHVASAEGVRALAFDLRSTYAYYLKVQVMSPDVKSKDDLVARSSQLIGELLPEIMRCVPDWAEVEAGRYPVKSGK